MELRDPMKIRLALLALMAVATGCNSHMSVDEYSHSWRAAVLKYRSLDKSPDQAVSSPGEVPGEATRNAAIAVADQLHQIAHDLQDLDAPDSVQSLQEQTILFYDGQSDAFRIYGESVMSGNASRQQQAVDGLNSYVDEHQDAVSKEIARLGTKDLFQPAWSTI